MELIDKAAIAAEIKKRINYYQILQRIKNGAGYAGRVAEGEEILDYINTLEVKELDLEDEYMVDREIAREKSILDETKVEYFATGNPTIAAYSEDNLRNQFDAGADWMKEQMIKAFAKTPEVKEVDLEKEIIRISKNEYFDFTDWKSIARHFFELGIKVAQKRE